MPSTNDDDLTDPQARSLEVVRLGAGKRVVRMDAVAHEEPLEIQVQGASVAVVMRTPGADLDLALGFLLSEGIIERASDVVSMRHCASVKSDEAEDNILRVVLAPEVELPLSKLRRNTFASSSCGLCGKATIESTLTRSPRLEDGAPVRASLIRTRAAILEQAQATFARTGGLHAAGLFLANGETIAVREDVGRHNAVDKVIGVAAREGLRGTVLFVSGRISFEIVQKAAVARVPVVAGISAPTSLAVAFGIEANLTVIGFARGDTMNVYAAAHRITDD